MNLDETSSGFVKIHNTKQKFRPASCLAQNFALCGIKFPLCYYINRKSFSNAK